MREVLIKSIFCPLALCFVVLMVQCLRILRGRKKFYSQIEGLAFLEKAAAVSWSLTSLYFIAHSGASLWNFPLYVLVGGIIATAFEFSAKLLRVYPPSGSVAQFKVQAHEIIAAH